MKLSTNRVINWLGFLGSCFVVGVVAVLASVDGQDAARVETHQLRLDYGRLDEAVSQAEVIVEARFLSERIEETSAPLRREDLVREFKVLRSLRGPFSAGDQITTRWTERLWFPGPSGQSDVVRRVGQPQVGPDRTYLLFLGYISEQGGALSLAVRGEPAVAELVELERWQFLVSDEFALSRAETGAGGQIPDNFIGATRSEVNRVIDADERMRANRPAGPGEPNATLVIPPEGAALQTLLDELPGLQTQQAVIGRARALGLYGLADRALCFKVQAIVSDRRGEPVELGCN